MKKKICIFGLLIIMGIVSATFIYKMFNYNNIFELTDEEKKWIKSNKDTPINLNIEEGEYYYNYLLDDVGGGFINNVVNALKQQLGLKLVVTCSQTSANKDSININLVQSNGNYEGLIKNEPIIEIPFFLYIQSDLDNGNLENINHASVAILKKDYNEVALKETIQTYDLDIKVLESMEELTNKIRNNNIQGFILPDNSLNNMVISDSICYSKVLLLKMPNKKYIFETVPSNELLSNIVNKKMGELKEKGVIERLLKYSKESYQKKNFYTFLTKEEKLYIDSLEGLNIGLLESNVPYSYKKGQKIVGIDVSITDHMRIILGIPLTIYYGEASKLEELFQANSIDLLRSNSSKDNLKNMYNESIIYEEPIIEIFNKRGTEFSEKADAMSSRYVYYQDVYDGRSTKLENRNLTDIKNFFKEIKANKVSYGLINKMALEFYNSYENVGGLRIRHTGDTISQSYLIQSDNKELQTVISKYLSLYVNEKVIGDYSYEVAPIKYENKLAPTFIICIILLLSALYYIKTKIIREQLTKENEIINHTFRKDQLTRLSNKYGMKKKFDEQINDGSIVYLVLADIKNLKHINDTYGRVYGDRILINVARSLALYLDDRNMLSRVEGNTFGWIMYEPSLNECIEIIKSLGENINKSKFFEQNPIAFRLNVGIAIYNQHADNYDELYKYAEYALYYSKQQESEQITVFSKVLFENHVEEEKKLEEIKVALKKEEFVMVYQPQTMLPDEVVIGAEALIRWKKPGKGMLSPYFFVGIMEKNGLISELDYYVIKKVFTQVKLWQEKGFKKMKISLNVSSQTIEYRDMVGYIKKLIEEIKIDPSWIAIEITEEAGLSNIELIRNIMRELQAMGILFALDDFGKGYSSISYLDKLPFDILKIDKEYVDHIHEDERAQSVYHTINKLAENFSMQVIVEGVEYQEQVDIIKKKEGTIVQGYFYEKPIELEHFEAYLNRATNLSE
ncbi:MAG: bifunctional diguanylate cyclase/phosphodiesterase [Clostridia bacterium]|nr:bifunctional diguanylate cyclase/phosphodiesterase [Clostridia bacterium]MDD4047870.1 bifunctional diguanylate cyclase/phosphodiesterase [Clostridia bacterium]